MEFRGTTICAVKRGGVTAIAGDGQVTMGESVVFKNTAIKVRRIYRGQGHTRLCGLGYGCVFSFGEIRGDVEQVCGQSHALGGRACRFVAFG